MMKLKKAVVFLMMAVTICVLFGSCGTNTCEFRDDKYIIQLEIPDDYVVYDCNSKLNKEDNFDAKIIERINNGMVIDAVNSKTDGEITVYVTKDALSESIGNFSTVSQEMRDEFSQEYQKGLAKSDHIFLCNPDVVSANGVEYVRILARVGSSTSGYSYLSYVTVINGEFFDVTVYMPQTIPTEEEIENSETILRTARIDIQGLDESLKSNSISQALTIAAIVVSCLVIVAIIIIAIRGIFRKSKKRRDLAKKIREQHILEHQETTESEETKDENKGQNQN